MKRRYTLDAKIDALNQIDQYDGDLQRAGKLLEIPVKTLENWRAAEESLRADYRERQTRHLERLQFDLQIKMIEHCHAILAKMDENTLAQAPLTQLNSALSALLKHVNILQEAPTQHEKIKFQYHYHDPLQTLPPWTGASHGQPRALQSRRLRTPLGQNRTRNDQHHHSGISREQTLLVAGAHPQNGLSGLARLEKYAQTTEKQANQRKRTPH